MGLSDHLDKLRSFTVIAETGSLREAAERLHVTQPALSRMIKTLELSSGVALFVRSQRGLSLTSAGQELHRYASRTLKELTDVEIKMTTKSDTFSGHIQVGTYESLVEYMWPDFLREIQKKYPDLAISLRTNSPVGMMELLRREEIDILVDAEPRTTSDFVSWPIYKDRFNFYLHQGGASKITQESAKDMTLIYVPQAFDEDGKTILHHLESQGYQFAKKLSLDSFTSAHKFCSKGLGLAVLPTRLHTSHSIIPTKLNGFNAQGFGEHTICATIRYSQKDHPQISELIKHLKQWHKASK